MKIRLTMAALVAAVSCLAGVSAASAQPHQSGLVNVAVVDNTVQIPIGVAANVCGVSVAVLAEDLAGGPVTCDIAQGQRADAALKQINLINQ